MARRPSVALPSPPKLWQFTEALAEVVAKEGAGFGTPLNGSGPRVGESHTYFTQIAARNFFPTKEHP